MKQRFLVCTDNTKIDTKMITGNDQLEVDFNDLNGSDLLTEYDVILMDFKNPYLVYNEKNNEIPNFIDCENKCLIICLNKYNNNHQNLDNYPMIKSIVGSNVNPSTFFTRNSKGKSYELTKECEIDIIKSYLDSTQRDWECSLHQHYVSSAISLAVNSEGKSVAFKIQAKAEIYFLPMLQGRDSILLECILAIIKKTNTSQVKDWVKQYSFPKLLESIGKISTLKGEIEKINGFLEVQQETKKKYENIRNVLMYFDGDILHSICREVLNEIGIKAVDGVTGREDLVFLHEGKHFIVEVKGSTKSASKKNVSQLNSHATQYENDNEVKTKRILLINAWRELPMEERNTHDKPIFPEDIMKLVRLTEVCLITTQQLFVAYCEHLDGKFDVNEFVNAIDETNGIFLKCSNILDYKK